MAYIFYLAFLMLPLACGATPLTPTESQAKAIFWMGLDTPKFNPLTFKKTDGIWRDTPSGKFYQLEFEATVQALVSNRNEILTSHHEWDFNQGDILIFTGHILFEKAESGWRPTGMTCWNGRKKGDYNQGGCRLN